MATMLSIAVLVITVTSLVIAAALSLTYGGDLASRLADGSLDARGGLKVAEVERYVRQMTATVATVAASPSTAEATAQFTAAFKALDATPDSDAGDGELAAFYRDQFAPELEEALGKGVSWRRFLPSTPAGTTLQQLYVASEDASQGGRRIIDDAGDGSEWSAVHAEWHPRFLEIADRYGVRDIAIIEPERGVIVYSVAKAPDFATSLELGPHSGTTLAAIARQVRNDPVPGAVSIADLASYTPQVGQPAGFFAGPIFDETELIGVLVFQFGDDALNEIMTSDGGWDEEGFGRTGEAYIVGGDGRMRSVSRSFTESRERFQEAVESAQTATAEELRVMMGVGTTSTFQRVADQGDFAEFGTEPFDRTNYLGESVAASYRPIGVEGLNWGVLTEVARAELDAPIADFQRAVLIAVAVFVILITFATVIWAGQVFGPLRSIAQRLRRIHEGEAVAAVSVEEGPREFVELSSHIGYMLDVLSERQVDLAAAAAERMDTVRNMLPPAIAERVEAGDRQLLDEIPQATVIVLVFDGIGGLADRPEQHGSAAILDRLVDELDSLATLHGLERVKVVGDAYYAGCGLAQPYLDHAPRSVAFTLDARDLCNELSREESHALGMAAGVHTGAVTVGLAGSARLVYDLWGETVDTADFLARSAKPGEILVSEGVASRLPDDYDVARRADPLALTSDSWLIVGKRAVEEHSR
jgi:class 3 adenylate cyclase